MRRVLLTLLALFIAAFLGTGWYLYDRGFTREWRTAVINEFHKRGVELYLRKLSLDPRRGLVARGVKVLDLRDRRRVLAEIDEMILQVNYANLLRGKTFLDALDLRDAKLALPVDPTDRGSPRIEVSKLNARLFLPPQQIYLAFAEAELFGIHINASGRLINPQDVPRGEDQGADARTKLLARIIEELQATQFEGGAPGLDVRFSGDLSRPETIAGETTFWAERIRRGGYLARNVHLAANYRDGLVDLKRFSAEDHAGRIQIDGTFSQAASLLDLQVQSTIDLRALVRALKLSGALDDFAFHESPAVKATVEARMGEQRGIRIVGHAALKKFAYKTVTFDSLQTDFSWDGDRWCARDFRLAHKTGAITGDALSLPGDFRASLLSTVNPRSFQPLLPAQAAQVLSRFEFRTPPRITAEVRGPEANPEKCTIEGEVRLGGASYRGVACENLRTPIRFEKKVLTVAPFRVQRTEGSGTGALIFDFKRDEVRLDKIRANVHPAEVARWIDPDLVKDIAPYRFKRAPNLFIDGLVHMKNGKSTRLNVDVDAPAGMDYTFLRRNLSSSRVAAKLSFSAERMKIQSFSAALFGGRLTGSADISIRREKPGHGVNMQFEEIDFATLTKLYFDYGDSQGKLSGRYDFTGRGDDARTMQGRGQFVVLDGNVFAIPLLGPFSAILNSIVPGMGVNVARRGAASFTIEDGVIDTRDLVIEGKGFSMIGNGKLFYLEDRMDFDMRINAQGLPGVLLFPVSKLLEYTSDEKISKPNWRPKVVPKL